jgi:hypothetical protein
MLRNRNGNLLEFGAHLFAPKNLLIEKEQQLKQKKKEKI